MADLLDHWVKAVYSAMSLPVGVMAHNRRIVNDFGFTLPYEVMSSGLDYTDIGYTKAKFTQLKRNYWNSGLAKALVEKLQDRGDKPHSSVAMPLGNAEKGDSRSQGHCMQSLVVTQFSDHYHIDIYYRSTELAQKFLADLIFLGRMIKQDFESLGDPRFIRFRFANAYLSTVMTPILFRYDPNPVRLFKLMKTVDPIFYKYLLGEMRRFNDPNPNYTYRTRIKMIRYYQDHVDPKKMKPLIPLIPKKVCDEDIPDVQECD
jgi:hypothetical protein